MTSIQTSESGGLRRALSGLSVVDFGWNITAPISAKWLADFGATVVKVESSKRTDPVRTMVPYCKGISGINRSILFHPWNAGKYSIALDLRHPKGIDIAKRLIKWADIVVENFMPGTMEKLGLGYEELRKVNPGIIMVGASLQGQKGPHAQVGALGIAMQALTGFIYPLGWPGEPPIPIPFASTDFMTPVYIIPAVLATLDDRRRTGKGTYIDISQFEAGVSFIAPELLNYLANGQPQTRMGNHSPYASPHNAYRCKGDDRWCVIAVFSEEEWKSFCGVVGNPPWTKETRFSSLLKRKENEEELDKLVGEWTINHSPEEIMEMMQSAGVAAGIVESGKDLHEDPQLKYRHHFWTLPHSDVGEFTYDGPPFNLPETPAEVRMSCPCLGEHTEFVCREILHMSNEEFSDMYQAGVLS